VRWGLGHSAGLIVVAAIFIILKGELDLRLLGRYCDFLVGLFMVILGTYAVADSLSLYHKKRNKKDSIDEDAVALLETGSSCPPSNLNLTCSSDTDKPTWGSIVVSVCPSIDMQDPFTQRIVSFLIGLLHGVAGPGTNKNENKIHKVV